LNDMGVERGEDREYFLGIISMFAELMNKDANKRKLEASEELSAFFHWRIVNPQKFFKVHITYIHSEEWLMRVDGFETMTFEEYMDSILQEPEFDHDCGCTKIVNKQSSLANGTEKPQMN